MAQNENREESQKSEHDNTGLYHRLRLLYNITHSLAEADGARCGREVSAKTVLAGPACTLTLVFTREDRTALLPLELYLGLGLTWIVPKCKTRKPLS